MLGAGLAGLILVLCVAVGMVAAGFAAYATAVNAADAAALAAAPVTFRPFGASGTAFDEASRYARLNGARLVVCHCRTDPTWRPRTVRVTVVRRIDVPVIGAVDVRASSRATFDPLELIPGS